MCSCDADCILSILAASEMPSYPDRPVVAFTGDGGFLMTVAELQAATRP
jgi:thiamine pyrophosphate-dependent acetolactate synthase large subunit-like protein